MFILKCPSFQLKTGFPVEEGFNRYVGAFRGVSYDVDIHVRTFPPDGVHSEIVGRDAGIAYELLP